MYLPSMSLRCFVSVADIRSFCLPAVNTSVSRPKRRPVRLTLNELRPAYRIVVVCRLAHGWGIQLTRWWLTMKISPEQVLDNTYSCLMFGTPEFPVKVCQELGENISTQYGSKVKYIFLALYLIWNETSKHIILCSIWLISLSVHINRPCATIIQFFRVRIVSSYATLTRVYSWEHI